MKQKKFIRLTQDLMFKSFFSKDKAVLSSLLKNFLPALKNKEIINIQILNPENRQKTKEEKQRIEEKQKEEKEKLISLDSAIYPSSLTKKQITLDLRLKLDTGENINVEMQSLSQKAFIERILFYWAKLYTEDLKKGESYQKLYPAYSLIFTNFDVLSLKDYMNSFSIRMDKEPFEELTNHLKIVIVELSKFECDDLIHLDKKASWCYVLKESENIGIREIEILEEKGLGGAMALLKRVSEDDRLRYEQESRDKFLFDQHWDRIYKFEEGMEKGIEKGMEKGIEKGKEEIILNMLESGFGLDSICKATKLSKEKIRKIQKK